MKKSQRRYREDLSHTPEWLKKKKLPHRQKYLSGPRILPKGIKGRERAADLLESTFLAYNAARLREGCRLFTEKMLEPDVTIGMSLSGALTPAGLGCSSIVPLIKAGFVDWIVATGANLYHDLHFARRDLQIVRAVGARAHFARDAHHAFAAQRGGLVK